MLTHSPRSNFEQMNRAWQRPTRPVREGMVWRVLGDSIGLRPPKPQDPVDDETAQARRLWNLWRLYEDTFEELILHKTTAPERIRALGQEAALDFLKKMLGLGVLSRPDTRGGWLVEALGVVWETAPDVSAVQFGRYLAGFGDLPSRILELEDLDGGFDKFMDSESATEFAGNFVRAWWAYGAMVYFAVDIERVHGIPEPVRAEVTRMFVSNVESASLAMTQAIMDAEDRYEKSHADDLPLSIEERIQAANEWVTANCAQAKSHGA